LGADRGLIHVHRWLSHILSFPAAVRDKWPGAKGPSSSSASSAASAASDEKKPAAKKAAADDDDDFVTSLDDDDDDDAAAAILAKKKAEADAAGKKKDGKPKELAKSTIVFDVKPEDSDTNLDEVIADIRKSITMEGLHWGAADKIPVAYGIFKIRIMATVVDDLVSTDDLEEKLQELKGVQSIDIYAFNKL